jgi:hypothetical protein
VRAIGTMHARVTGTCMSLLLSMLMLTSSATLAQTNNAIAIRAETPVATVSITYAPEMSWGTGDAIRIRLVPQPSADLGCIQPYLDFQYVLRDSSGTSIPPDSKVLSNPPSGISSGSAFLPGGCFPKGLSQNFRVGIGILYPHLTAGRYTLQMTFAPRKLTAIRLELPPLSFDFTPPFYGE